MVPAGKSGDWEVVYHHVSDEVAEAEAWDMYMKHGDQGLRRRPRAGDHVALRNVAEDICYMSTQPFELDDNQRFVELASGRVLVSGLGLGLILPPLSQKCDYVVVLEKEKDVISLVAPHIDLPNVEVLHADVLEWEPRDSEHFDWAWHDIWATITPKNIKEMYEICKRYEPYVDRQVCWSWDLIVDQLKEKVGVWEEAPLILRMLDTICNLCYAV